MEARWTQIRRWTGIGILLYGVSMFVPTLDLGEVGPSRAPGWAVVTIGVGAWLDRPQELLWVVGALANLAFLAGCTVLMLQRPRRYAKVLGGAFSTTGLVAAMLIPTLWPDPWGQHGMLGKPGY